MAPSSAVQKAMHPIGHRPTCSMCNALTPAASVKGTAGSISLTSVWRFLRSLQLSVS